MTDIENGLLYREEVIEVDKSGSVVWSAITAITTAVPGGVAIHQEGDIVVLPPEYIPGIIKALEKALEKP